MTQTEGDKFKLFDELVRDQLLYDSKRWQWTKQTKVALLPDFGFLNKREQTREDQRPIKQQALLLWDH